MERMVDDGCVLFRRERREVVEQKTVDEAQRNPSIDEKQNSIPRSSNTSLPLPRPVFGLPTP